jgi:hypothetical protein
MFTGFEKREFVQMAAGAIAMLATGYGLALGVFLLFTM